MMYLVGFAGIAAFHVALSITAGYLGGSVMAALLALAAGVIAMFITMATLSRMITGSWSGSINTWGGEPPFW